MAADVKKLIGDETVINSRGVFEYLLGGSVDKKLLGLQFFEASVTRVAYARQNEETKANGKSNCPHCAMSDNSNKSNIHNFKEMEADHVAAWSKGGARTPENCEMFCITHNRLKGNR